MAEHSTILQDISFSIIFAVFAAHIMKLLRQPLLLGYVIGGILLGSNMGFGLVYDKHSIEIMSEIGLILLLFIIGLEINLKEIARMGKSMLVLAIAQIGLSVVLGYIAFSAFLGGKAQGFDVLYIAMAISLSSTLIVVKLLHDKFEVRTLPGKLTIGILVFQDIWAILFMGVQPNLANPEILTIGKSILFVVILVLVAFFTSRYILARLFHASSKAPELILLTAIAWSFLLAAAAAKLGLSMEMGALIAGVSIAAFPYGVDVISKLAGIRDFFVTLFFVSLGLKMPVPGVDTLVFAFVLILVVLITRLVSIIPTVRLLEGNYKPGILAALNLSQISEFALVIMTLGVSYGHISQHLSGTIVTTMLLFSVVSTYLISYNNEIAGYLFLLFNKLGLKDRAQSQQVSRETKPQRDIVVLGFFRIAGGFLDIVEQKAPKLKKRISVVDYRISNAKALKERGFNWIYGDLAHPEALEHSGIDSASTIFVSISDTFLKGTNSMRLLATLKKMSPKARIIMVAEDDDNAIRLKEAGADHVLIPGQLTGISLYHYLFDLTGSYETIPQTQQN